MKSQVIRKQVWQCKVLTILIGLFLTSCQLPDVSSFANAAGEVHKGVDQSGVIFYQAAIEYLDEDSPDREKLKKGWQERRKATEALVMYSGSLVSIVDASTNVSQNVKSLGDAIDDFGSLMGEVGLAGKAAFRVGGEFYKFGAKIVAHEKLFDAVSAAQPMVAKVSKVISDDLGSMQVSMQRVKRSVESKFYSSEIKLQESRLLALESQLNDVYQVMRIKTSVKRKEYTTRIASQQLIINGLQAKVGGGDSSKETADQLSKLEDGLAQLKLDMLGMKGLDLAVYHTKITSLNSLISPIKDSLKKNAELKKLAIEKIYSQIELIERTKTAIEQIKVTHMELAKSLKESRALTAGNLVFAAQEINRTIDNIERIKSKENE